MKKGRVAVIASILAGLGGASVACSAVLGIADFTAGDGGSTPRDGAPDHGGPVGDGGPGGEAGLTCADEDGGAGVIGCACNAQTTTTGCNGHAQTERLLCSGGTWTQGAPCSAGSNCDTRAGNQQGTCATVDPNCSDASPGQQLCIGSSVILCGPDLVSETPVTTCSNQACVDGGCTGMCTPGATQCAGTGVLTCSPGGEWDASASCSELCSDGGCASFPSCAGGGGGADTTCGGGGDAGTTDCCASYDVTGGTFYRSYDGVSASYTSKSNPATVSPFRLDAYEVTVGRFRKFVGAVGGGWRPTAGAGKHTHLNGGAGLTSVGGDAGVGSEPGWAAGWSSNLTSLATSPTSTLACATDATWSASAGTGEAQPINCVSWYEAYAFCIWDGGFLPSEAEWNYAASGGNQQRVYPWSIPPGSTTIDCTYANFNPGTACSSTGPNAVGSEAPNGNGLFGQSDLAGNLAEWTLDTSGTTPTPYVSPCTDCANLAPASSWAVRGGSYDLVAFTQIASYRFSHANRDATVGIRCARTP